MDNQADQPPPRRRRRRANDPPSRRWKDPATPLQAARFERRWIARDVINRVRALCPGHSGAPCRMDASKLSDYENGKRRPGLTHVEVFCRLYQKSPEALGLIHWRDEPHEPPPASEDGSDNGSNSSADGLLQPARFDRLLAGPSDDEASDELLIELLAEAVALTSAASVACRELRTALKDRAAVTLA